MKRRVYDELVELASEQQGIVTSKDAARVGIDPAQLRMMTARGRLERVGRGVYRVPVLPVGELAPFAEAVAWAAGRAVVSHESALLLRGLGDFGGGRVDLTIPSNYVLRRDVPRRLRVWVETLGEEDLDEVDGVPTVTVAAALRQVVDSGSDPYQVRAAIGQATRSGFIDEQEARRLRYRLDHRPVARATARRRAVASRPTSPTAARSAGGEPMDNAD